ncbi:organelle RRM domain-containing protein 2, mitochondrial-like isoform X2 [Salvia hispanica]|uniref:organelle RRM domain-containing protein 2, mitochondrial-like isoform X2 n=1 Tax=Salvia hispanica TaxID=49212 RepID=UPI0020093E7D|nr:organelle RRM domain-containing protein 2, mitochondrial-like isoform X2 [Salvia hispanica]
MAVRAAVSANSRVGMGLLRKAFSSSFSTLLSQFKPPPAEPSTNLFVCGLNKRTTSEGLRDAFAKYGEVVQAKVITDHATTLSKGFGFVNYATIQDAELGMKSMDGQYLDNWVIFVEYAIPKGSFPK